MIAPIEINGGYSLMRTPQEARWLSLWVLCVESDFKRALSRHFVLRKAQGVPWRGFDYDRNTTPRNGLCCLMGEVQSSLDFLDASVT